MAKASPPVRRDQEELGDVFVLCLCLCHFAIGFVAPSRLRLCLSATLRSERKAIHWPSGDHCGELSWPDCVNWMRLAAGGAVEPEFFAEDLLVPVGLFGSDDDGVAIGRNFHRVKADRVEEFIESEFGLCGLRDRQE